jgi:hypothetical protein
VGFTGKCRPNSKLAQPFLLVQFRHPLSSNNPNTFALIVGTSPLEGGTAPGDSGGPVFIPTAARTSSVADVNFAASPKQ